MGHFKLDENNVSRLYELADLQHPHLKGDNYTRDLINKVKNGERLTTTEAFDCGKYYDRMLAQLVQLARLHLLTFEDSNEYLHAILAFKWCVK